MSPQELKKLRNNALALRNIADVVLAQVEQIERSASAEPIKPKKKKAPERIDFKTRLLTGLKYPTKA